MVFPLRGVTNEWFDIRYKTSPLYGGCFARNTLPQLEKKFYIVNLDKSSGNGTHWVLVSNTSSASVDYIDPVGVPYAPTHIENVIHQQVENGKKDERLDEQLQPVDSSACGYFCAMIADSITHYPEKSPLTYIRSTFGTGLQHVLETNQEIVRHYFELGHKPKSHVKH